MLHDELEIEFEFIAESNIPVVRIGFETSDGLVLETGPKNLFKENIKAEEVFSLTIVVVPELEEEFDVHLYLYSEDTEDKRAKLLSVPIPVGQYKIESKKK